MRAALKKVVKKLSQVIIDVRSASDSLSSASQQVSAASQGLSQGTSEQASSVEETSSSLEQMSANVTQNAENAKQTEGMATKAARDAEEGGQAVLQALDGFSKKFNATLHAMADVLRTLTESSEVTGQDISTVLFSLQFQDIVRQRLEYVIRSLEGLQTDLIRGIATLRQAFPPLNDWQPTPHAPESLDMAVTVTNHYEVNEGDSETTFLRSFKAARSVFSWICARSPRSIASGSGRFS